MQKYSWILPMFLSLSVCAQDPHFSQYYASESTTNPGFTGLFDDQVRMSVLYRQQWPQFGQPFISGLAAVECKTKKTEPGMAGGVFTAGLSVLFDKTPKNVFKSSLTQLQLGYQLPLDENGYHRVSLGMIGGLGQKTANANGLSFGNQFVRDGFNTAIPNGELVLVTQQNYRDISAGLVYMFEDDDDLLYGGASAFHLNQPALNFIPGDPKENLLAIRTNLQAGFNVASDKLRFAGSALYMNQSGINYLYGGAAVGLPFAQNDGMLYTGLWWRKNESIIPTLRLQYQSFNFGLSYDVPYTNQTYTKPRSLEFALFYSFSKLKNGHLRCFRF